MTRAEGRARRPRGGYLTLTVGKDGTQTLVGSDGQDVIIGLAGNDGMRGMGDDPKAMGGAGRDVFLFGMGGGG